jgi:hypothetical protein
MLLLYYKWGRNQYWSDVQIFPNGFISPELLKIIYNAITYEELCLSHSVVASTHAIWTSCPTTFAELYQRNYFRIYVRTAYITPNTIVTVYPAFVKFGWCLFSRYFLIIVMVPYQHRLGLSNKTRLLFLNLWFRNSLPEVVWRGGSGPRLDLGSGKVLLFSLHAV